MKILFLLVALLWFSGLVDAQAVRPAANPDPLSAARPTPPAAPDTVAALHRLFAAKRKRKLFVIAVTIVAAGTGLALSGNLSEGIASPRAMAQGIIPVLSISIIGEQGVAYALSHRNEAHVIQLWRARRLPERIKAELTPTYFD